MNKNKLITLTGTSAAGKSFLMTDIVNCGLNIEPLVRATTRPARKTEVNGVDAQFFTRDEFEYLEKHNEFLTVNEYLDQKYGFLRADVEKLQHENLVTINHYKNVEKMKKLVPNTFATYIMSADIQKTFSELGKRDVFRLETSLREFDCMEELNWINKDKNKRIFDAIHTNTYDEKSVLKFRELVQKTIA